MLCFCSYAYLITNVDLFRLKSIFGISNKNHSPIKTRSSNKTNSTTTIASKWFAAKTNSIIVTRAGHAKAASATKTTTQCSSNTTNTCTRWILCHLTITISSSCWISYIFFRYCNWIFPVTQQVTTYPIFPGTGKSNEQDHTSDALFFNHSYDSFLMETFSQSRLNLI